MFGYKKQLFLLAVIGGFLFPNFNVDAAPKWRTGYYANQEPFATMLPLSDVPWQKYTHVIQGFIVPIAGAPWIDANVYSIGNGPGSRAEKFVTLAQANDVKAVVSLVVGTTHVPAMENNTNTANINAFVSALAAFVTYNKYDGIDIDWEAPTSNFSAQFPEFIRLLRGALPNKIITVAGSADFRSTYAYTYQDGTHVYDKIDQINVMNYDMDGGTTGGKASPITWFNTAVRLTPCLPNCNPPYPSQPFKYDYSYPDPNDPTKKIYGTNNWTQDENMWHFYNGYTVNIPRAKLGLGVPFYGYIKRATQLNSSDGVTAPRQTYLLHYDPVKMKDVSDEVRMQVAYSQLMNCINTEPDPNRPPIYETRLINNTLLPCYSKNGTLKWDDIQKAPYISYLNSPGVSFNIKDLNSDAFVTYTNPQQIDESIRLINEKGLGGIMTFALNHEYFANKTQNDRYPLSTAVFNSMLALGNTDANGVNVAYGKQATQSSTFNRAAANLAVDGNTNGIYSSGSVTHTDTGVTNAWWEVDLQGTFNINQIRVWDRTDTCCTDRLKDFTTSILDENRSVVWSYTLGASPNPLAILNPEGRYGRYVRISGPSILSLAEVQIYPRLQNIALGKLATQSSTFNNATASRAVDGNTNGIYSAGSVTHTDTGGTKAWWKVDLQGTFNIGQIKIWNRADCCKERLSNYFVDILDANENVVWSNFQATSPAPDITLMPGGIIGSYVKIYGPDILSLAEVEVIEY